MDRLLWQLLYSCDFNILVFLDFIYARNFTLLHYQIFVIFSIIILSYLSLSLSSIVIITIIIIIITIFIIVINFTITLVIIFTINCYQNFLFMFITIIINSTTAISFIISCFINRSERQVYSITLFDSPPQWLCDNKLVEHCLVHWYQQCVTAHRVPKCMSCRKTYLQMAAIYLVSLKQKYIYQSKNKIICQVTRHVQSKIQTYCLNKRFNISYHFTI